ncbi:MAG: AmmeMemoRadiSam system protein B [Bacteroidales bacterium]|nr:AmmeMemoRadiSam system protein B [Bacteroidales bacterium]
MACFSFSDNPERANIRFDGSVRPEAVAGSFYPADKAVLQKTLERCFSSVSGGITAEHNIAALIVPHAGYVFSGGVAASAFSYIPEDASYDHIFLLGPSHHAYISGASINDGFDYYSTPLGKVPVDVDLCRRLIKEYPFFTFDPLAHEKEHCLEVQLPFLQYRLKKMPPIIPIIVGSQNASVLHKISKALEPYFNSKNLFVISSDFSHYPTYEGAEKADRLTGEAISSGSYRRFIESLEINESSDIKGLVTSACGQSPILVLLYMTSGAGDIVPRHVMYSNSGDSEYGEKDRVVGYHSFVFTRMKNDMCFDIPPKDRETLLSIARNAIAKKLEGKQAAIYDEKDMSDVLKMHCGAFVTLNENGRLRGCIGLFGASEKLYLVVRDMAVEAAFEDSRFMPLKKDELNKIRIEISVLSPLRQIYDINEIELGRDGIYMIKGSCGGTFLPQVAAETGWTREEFLGHCARDKAGIGWDGWRDADLYTYEAVVFGEK